MGSKGHITKGAADKLLAVCICPKAQAATLSLEFREQSTCCSLHVAASLEPSLVHDWQKLAQVYK